jgi:tetratricopeptide repeat protein
MSGQAEHPSRFDLREGKGVQAGSGINVQFNDYHFGATASPERSVRLPAARPVRAWDPFDLGIWPVLTIPGSPQSQELPTLPPYVARDHDTDIDSRLTDTASCMIVVTGTSCTGKSRSLYEALLRHDQIRDWQLRFPADSEQLLGLLVGEHLAPRTVLWLTDLDQYLLSPLGEPISAALRDVLRQPSIAPVAIVATLWPQHWDNLAQEPRKGSSAPYPQAWQLLTRQCRRVRIPENFAKWSRHDLMSAVDPRLAEAARLAGDGGEVIQALAGGPFLVDRCLHPGDEGGETAFSRAVILAAIDARRAGVGSVLPRTLLEQAARGYLTPEARLEAPADWPVRGLNDAAQRQRGVWALQPRWHTDGTGPADAYRLHDFLAQHGVRLRDEELIPASFWDAAADTPRLPGSTYMTLANAARDRFLYGYADRFFRLAIVAGAPDAYEGLLHLLRAQGRHGLLQAELEPIRSRAARGDLAAHRILVRELQKLDRDSGEEPSAELRAACEAAVEAGCEDLREILADILVAVGADERAIDEYRRVIEVNPDTGNVRLRIIRLLVRRNRIEEAHNLVSAAPDHDRRRMFWNLVEDLIDAGLADRAVPLIHSALDTAQLPDPVSGSGLTGKLASITGGVELLHLLAERGFGPADYAIRRLAVQNADDDELDRLEGDEAREERARRLAEAGCESKLRRLSDQGDHLAGLHLALLLEKKGRIAEAIAVLRPLADAAAAAPFGALRREPAKLVALLEEAGQHEALHELVLSNQLAYGRPLADWCYRNNRRSDLEHLAGVTGDKYVRRRLAWLLRDNGDHAALEELATRSGAAHRELIDSLVGDDNVHELYRRVLLSDGYARRVLKRLIEDGDRRIPTATLRSNGLTPSGHPAGNQ